MVVQNLPSERKLPMGKVQKKVKKTNNSAFSATHTYIKLTLVSFFYFFFYAPFPNLSLQIGIFNAVIEDTPNENGGNVIHQERLLILNTHYEGNTKKKT